MLLHGTLRAPHQPACSAPTQLATMSPKASIQSGFLQFHPMFCFVLFFSVSRMLQNSTFLPPLSQTNRIYPLHKPQSAKSTKPFCDSLFPETRLYILPIHTQYQLCSPRLQIIEFSSTRAPLQSLREPPGLLI